MDRASLGQELIRRRDHDLAVRQRLLEEGTLSEGYNEEMRAVHEDNAAALERYLDAYGFPTVAVAGQAVQAAAWLIAQHAVSRPPLLRRWRDLLAAQPPETLNERMLLAHLEDRIAVFEGRPQRYGTQFDWDERGQLSPQRTEDVVDVNRRRQELRLLPLAEQTERMRAQAVAEGLKPPANRAERQQKMLAWLKEVGWTD